MTNHRITITLRDNAAIPELAKQTLYVGDTIVYVTDPPNLRFRVEFSISPFTNEPQDITDSIPRTLIREGKFESKCFITLPNGNEVGWHLEAPQSGGEHDVRP